MEEKKISCKPLPISEYQKRFFLEWALAPNDTVYNTSLVNKIIGNLDVKILKQACKIIVEQNELAHARYSEDGLKCYSCDYEIDDFYHESVLDLNHPVESQLRAVLENPFDLTKDVLLRFHLVRNHAPTTPEYYFVICAHHIIADAISALQITKQVQDAYNGLMGGSAVLVERDNSFSRAVEAEQQALNEGYRDKAQKFWLDFTDDSFPQPSLPYRSSIDPINLDDRLSDKTGEFLYFDLGSTQAAQLKAYAKQNRTTVFIVLSALYGLVLSKYCNQEKITLSYPINMRPQGFRDVTGCFVNNLPLKIDFSSAATIEDVLKSLGEQRKEVKPHQGYSLVDIIQDQRKCKNNDFSKILKIGFVQANLNTTLLELTGVEVSPIDISSSEKVDFEIELLYDEYSSNLIKFKLGYRKNLFDRELMERFVSSFKSSISEALNGNEIVIRTFSALSLAEYEQLVYKWNATDKAYSKEKTIHRLFEEQVERTLDNVAIVYEGQILTYQQLNGRSNQLARHIRAQYQERTHEPMKADTLIALYMERGPEMIIGILAVLKAGGAYVPINISYPQERLDYIINDTQAELILTNKHFINSPNIYIPEDKIVCVDLSSEIFINNEKTNLPNFSEPKSLAYIIYTSGTTGNPKGTMIEHANIMRLFTSTQHQFNFKSHDVWTLFHSYGFDFSVWELWGALIYGGKLLIISEEQTKDFSAFFQLCQQQAVTVLNLTPSAFYRFADIACQTTDGALSLRYIIFGGEALNIRQLTPWWNYQHDHRLTTKLINMYGITETTVHVTYKEITCKEKIVSNIGKSLADLTSYVLDANMSLVPIGVVGELYIGGAGLARGYLKRSELTSERFLPNPFARGDDKAKGYDRLYKTGDLVRWLPDGDLEFIGRNDDQIKIRGFRIELGEIEQALLKVEGVKQCCVLAKDKKVESGINKYLVAYFVPEHSNCSLTQETILDKLAKILPEYMIPNILVELYSLPLTINGKLDKRALPEPDFISAEKYIAPRTEIEIKLCKIWQEVLGIDRIGITDDFFRIGGNSILAIRLTSAINVNLDAQISVRDIFACNTISKLSNVIQKSLGSFKYQNYLINDGFIDENEAFGLNNVQQAYRYGRLENFEMGNVSTHTYSEMLFTQINSKKLEAAINYLIQRHGALRTIFKGESQYILQDIPYYRIHNNGKINLAGLESIRNRLSHKVYEVDQWPLFDIEISRSEELSVLHFSFDALTMDGASMGIFSHELALLYNSEDIERVILPELKINFRDYMLKYAEVRSSELFTKAKQYWINKLNQYNFDSQLPMVENPASITQPRFARITRTIPQSEWQLFEEKSKRYNIGTTSVVLYAYGQVLSRWSGQSNFCVNLTLFNRLPIHEQVNDILGDFTVLELFNFRRLEKEKIITSAQKIYEDLWNDIEHNLFDGIDFQRLIRKELGISQTQTLSPVVLTSMLGNDILDRSLSGYLGTGYEISQTPQVYIDNKAYQSKDGFIAEWDYVEQLFDPETIKQMHADYCRLIEYLAETDWEDSMPELSLSEQDAKVVDSVNNFYQAEVTKTLVDICLSSITETPTRIAIIDTKNTFTYQAIGEYSYHVAGYLCDHDLSKPNHLIGILSEKGYQQVVSTLGIMQSGAAYLPLHVDWPLGRVDEILEEGMVKTVMVSQSEYIGSVKGNEIETKYRWLVIEEVINYQPNTTKEQLPKLNLDDIAYVIFTSGSTGKPKGVTISHRGAVNTIQAVNEKFSISVEDKVLALSELSFDLSVYDIFGLLAAGGTIVFPNQKRTKEPGYWYHLLNEYSITIWDTVPQLMQLLVDYVHETNQKLDTLRVVLMSGDWIPVKLPEQIRALTQAAVIMSLGGATEGSIWSIWYDIKEVDPKWTSIPYGYAMPNQKMYVLNEFKELSPIGVTGDIYIGGQGVAIGYWNDEIKTQNSFTHHENLGRLYKTGDLGRWNKSGYIEFEGRKDNQVKLNGYRVELDEISSKLTGIKGVDKALVAIQENQLVAYLVAGKLQDQQGNTDIEEQSNSKIILDKKERELFRFEQKGIRKDLLPVYELNGLDLNEKQYRLRKSYRQFESGSISVSKKELSTLITTAISNYYDEIGTGHEISLGNIIEILKRVLNPLSAIKLNDKALPKYLYPSGGSTNPIQCYVEITKDSEEEELKRGYYYYEPVFHYLSRVEEEHIKRTKNINNNKSNSDVSIILKFKLFKPAIEPLYGDMALRLAWLEMGHILALLEKQFLGTNLNGKLIVLDKEDGDYHHFVELAITVSKTIENIPLQSKLPIEGVSKPDFDYLEKDSQGFSDPEGHIYNISNQNIFARVSELGQLLESAQGLILFKGTNEPEALIRSGYQSQWLADQLYQKNIGSCLLGFAPFENVNYSMIVGQISDKQKALSEIQVKKVELEEYINQQIEQYLPHYMLPNYYLILGELPLTANGKVDCKKLPKVEITQNECVAPTTDIEIELCKIWKEILGVDKVGITDDFFQIGGNSILAIQVSHRMSKVLGCEIKVVDIFKYQTITQILTHNTWQEQIIIPTTTALESPLSFAQERLWFIEQYEQGSNAYHIPAVLELLPHTSINGLKHAFQQVIERHEVLRSTIEQGENKKHGVQIIHDDPIEIEDVTLDADADYMALLQTEANRSFTLNKEYPIRIKFYSIKSADTENTIGRRLLLINIHHIASDGWSMGILQKELLAYYQAYMDNDKTFCLPKLEIQYKDYAAWQRGYVTGKVLEKQIAYWRDKLLGYQTLEMPMDFIRPQVIDYRGASQVFTIDKELSNKIRALCQEHGVTLHSFMLSGVSILLSKYTGQEDIVIGSPIANRHYRQTQGLIGFFANTQVNRVHLDKVQTCQELILKVQQEQIAMQQHQDLPFERLVEELKIMRDTSRHPVFQVMFGVQKYENSSEEKRNLAEFFKPFESSGVYKVEKFDLSIFIDDSQQELTSQISYATSLFHKETIQRLIAHYQHLLSQLCETPEQPYGPLSLLSAGEYDQIVYQWNATDSDYPKGKTIHQLFQEQVERTPEGIAVVYEGQSLTYEELNERSNQLARHICTQYQERTHEPLKANTLIALHLDRSLEMIIGILAVLKVGGAYVPMDTSYPQERLGYMLEDTKAELILSQKNVTEANRAQLPLGKIILVDLIEELFSIEDTSNLPQHSGSADLAYVIYTSGTTGKPKGVMISHENIVRLFFNDKCLFDFNSSDVWTMFHSYCFDFSVWEMYGALLFGGRLVVISKEVAKDTNQFFNVVVDERVTILNQIPAAFYNFIEVEAICGYDKPSLRYIIFGGEALQPIKLKGWYEKYPQTKLINMYGITETTVHVTYKEITSKEILNNQGNIGKPIPTLTTYLLDENLHLQPISVVGEIYVGGAGVGIGYLNEEALTKERFIDNPYKPGGRLYRSGDLARWLPNGELEYLGRRDDQVKIRGFRIEIGEIEHALSQVPCIKQCFVMSKDRKTEAGSNKYLAGYYVANKDSVEERANFMMDLYKEKILDDNLSFYMLNKDLSAFSFRRSELEFLHKELFQSNTYSSHISISSGDLIFDVGANIGIGSLFFAHQADNLTIYSFEPIGNLYDVLNMNLFIYSHKASFKTFNCGIGEDNQNDVKFSFFRNNTVISSQYPDLAGDSKLMSSYLDNTSKSSDNKELVDLIIESQEEVTCQIRTISTIIREEKIKRIDLLKVDVEKAEMDVLNGIEECDWAKICQIVIEVHDKNNRLEVIKSILVHKGYTVYAQQDTDLQNSGLYIVYAIRESNDTVSDKKDDKSLFDNNVITEHLKTYKGWKGNGNLVSTEMLYEHLKTTLPEYMIPSIFIRMESFPLTVNGKLDKCALPDPDFSLSAQEYVAPTNEKEAELCKAWEDILGLDRVGITDNFFKIGGNSILAIQASYRMSKSLGCEIKVADIFKYKTIEQLIACNAWETQIAIPATTSRVSVLSFAQERLWFIEQYEQGSNAYHIPVVLELSFHTDVQGVKYALQQVVARHEVLRCTIEQGGNQEHGIQLVHDGALEIENITLNADADYLSLLQSEVNRPFRLSHEYPIRAKFYSIEPAQGEGVAHRRLLLINAHHIASDGWSMGILQKELLAYYQAYIRNDKAFSLQALEIQYKDFAVWQRSYVTGELLERQIAYWRDKLSGFQTLELPTDLVRPQATDYRGTGEAFIIAKELSHQVRALCQEYGVTLYSFMLSSISVLLSKYTGQVDIVTGSPIANRHHRQTQNLIGFFVNTQVNRIKLDKTQTYLSLIQEVQQDQVASQQYQDLPFERLVEEMDIPRDSSRHPIFQVMFGVQSFGGTSVDKNSLAEYFRPIESAGVYEVEKFDLSIFIDDSQDELTGQISYATSLFHGETIRRIIGHFQHLLSQLCEAPDQPYSQFSLLSAEEYEEIVYRWNATDKDYPKDKTIHQLFQEQVERTPEQIAIVYKEQTLTYKELNERSNQLARHIRAQYQERTHELLKADTLIALYLSRSPEMIICILAVIKAGGAYVPMDTSYPQDRLDYMLGDTEAELILSQKHVSETNGILPVHKVLHVDLSNDIYTIEDTSNLPQHSKPTNLAYVIYTSGTTGKPKGVMVEHKGINNLIQNQIQGFGIETGDKAILFASYVFDATVSEVFTVLTKGASLYIITDTIRSDTSFVSDFIHEQGIGIATLPPALLSTMSYKKLTELKTLVVAGETCPIELMEQWSEGRRLINAYGPTESTVCATMHRFTPGDTNTNIGRPLDNVHIYILDSNSAPVPIGVIGELYIGGAGVARGYLKRPVLTSERFVPNPFATEGDKANGYDRLYKTGDLVRWLPDGDIEFVGRNDAQVKIRGYRIELGEVEHAMLQISGIKQSCVLARERKTDTETNKYLIGYYVLDKTRVISQEEIISKLSLTLPDYMLPAWLIEVDAFPMTINGKLDKRALPDPEFSSDEEYIKPETDLEVSLCQIYAETLGLPRDQISTQQSFFKMGGNSILSIRLKQKINQIEEFKHITISDLFKLNSISKLIQSIQPDNFVSYNLQDKVAFNNEHEIAIISTSGAFSGVNSIAELWQLVVDQREGIQFYSKDECRELGIDEILLEDPNYIPVAGHVRGIKLFDPLFWDISPNEAKLLDPQIRKFIEHCWFVLESSGYIKQRKNLNIGVFAGSGNSNYFYNHILKGEMIEQVNLWEASVVNSKDALATQAAFFLGLSGSAISVNTACSTGLVSVVEACRNLRLGVCDMAIAGGVSLSMPEQVGYLYQEGMITSKDGHCRTFDIEASGTTGGSGVGVVLLKRFGDAIKDNDTILGVIKGYATNNDGDRKTGYTAPSVIGQSECIINAQRMAGVTPDQIDYIECHGTATHLGDPIEVQALREAFEYNRPKENRSKRKTILGAVKANIGHTDSAAGTAGLIKVCTMLQNNIIPGQVNFNEPNTELYLNQTNFEIVKENREWLPSQEKSRIAGVSSFGVGGTNAHVIVGDYLVKVQNQYETEVNNPDPSNYIVPFSAKSRLSLEHYRQELLKYLSEVAENDHSISIRDVSYTLQERREHFSYRSAYCARNLDDLIYKLKADTSYSEVNPESSNKVVFMFSGQGSQYSQMAKELYDNEPFFRNTINQCIALANQNLDIDLHDVIYPKEEFGPHNINEIKWSAISLFIIEYTLAEFLEYLGVKADAYIGHSFGEYVAATLSGVFKLEDAIKVVIARGKLMQSMQPGSMLAINAKEETVRDMVEGFNCEISVINSPEDIVASGYDKDIIALNEALDKQDIPTIKLNASVAGHSKLMYQASLEFESAFNDIKLNKPSKYFASNLSGEIAKDEVTNASYWCKQLRNTVQFANGIDTLCRQYKNQVSFIEVGPGKGLSSFVNKYKHANNYRSIQTIPIIPSAKEIKEAKDSEGQTNQIVEYKEDLKAKLWMSGTIQAPNERELFKKAKLQTSLPIYQFDYMECGLEKGKENTSNNHLKLLPKEKWLNRSTWSTLTNLNRYTMKDKTTYKNALIFLREDQLNSFDFRILAQEFKLIVLDPIEPNADIICTSEQIRINPVNESNFKKLGEHIKTKGVGFDTIIHIASVNNVADIDNALNFSFYSLFLIRQHLLSSAKAENLLVLTNGLAQITKEDVINPFNGTLVGAIRNINHELLNIDARIIDIGYGLERIDPAIIQVISSKDYQKSEELLAIRFGKVWVERHELVDNTLIHEMVIEDGDIILITGGLGGIALAIAKHISSKHKVAFILVSRKNIYEDKIQPSYVKQKIEIIEEIKANGSSIDIQCADISDKNQVSVLASSVEKNHGRITGIIHTAGVVNLSADKYSLIYIKNSLKGKVYGIDNIINTLNINQLKFLASTSSLASIMGDINCIEYCASNSYLDYLSVDKKRFPDTKVITINWPRWSDIGMFKEHKFSNEKNLSQLHGIQKLVYLNSVNQAEGADLFYQLITQTNFEQVAVSKLDINKLKNKLFKQDKIKSEIKQIAVVEKNYTETEYKIAQVFGEVLGVQQISTHDNFFSLGGNSLMAMYVVSLIKNRFNIVVPLNLIIRKPRISELSNNIMQNELYLGEMLHNDTVYLLNKEGKRAVFAFPPIIGYGIAFKHLSRFINDFSLYAFDFIEDENRLSMYVDIILSIQKEGPYILMGYSAGAYLAYDVAINLIERGYEVSDIIIVDASRRYEIIDIEEYNEQIVSRMVKTFMEGFPDYDKNPINFDFIIKEALLRTNKYSNYLTSKIDDKIVGSNFHLILSEEFKNENPLADWGLVSEKTVNKYQGKGLHIEMLSNPENLIKNSAIINEILCSLTLKYNEIEYQQEEEQC